MNPYCKEKGAERIVQIEPITSALRGREGDPRWTHWLLCVADVYPPCRPAGPKLFKKTIIIKTWPPLLQGDRIISNFLHFIGSPTIMAFPDEEPWGYKWRSSTPFIMTCIAITQFGGWFPSNVY